MTSLARCGEVYFTRRRGDYSIMGSWKLCAVVYVYLWLVFFRLEAKFHLFYASLLWRKRVGNGESGIVTSFQSSHNGCQTWHREENKRGRQKGIARMPIEVSLNVMTLFMHGVAFRASAGHCRTVIYYRGCVCFYES